MAAEVAPSIMNLSVFWLVRIYVPAFTVVDAKESLVECQAIHDERSAKLRQDKPAPISRDFAAVTETCKNATTCTKDVGDFIVVFEKKGIRGGE